MSIRLLTDDFSAKLLEAFEKSKETIRIISPFLSTAPAKRLIGVLQRNPQLSCTVITRFEHADFCHGASKIGALLSLLSHGAALFSLKDLHTKLYLIDDSIAILGSANFTDGGFNKNHELSLYIQDDADLIAELISYFDAMAAICNNPDGIITAALIQEELARISKETITTPACNFQYSHGAVKPHQAQKGPALSGKAQPNVWLKFVGVSNQLSIRKAESCRSYHIPHLAHLNMHYVSFPLKQRPSGIKKGDILYIAFLGTRKGSSERQSFLVAKGISAGFDPQQPYRDAIQAQEPKHFDQWPIYMELEQCAVFPGSCNEAMPLSALWKREGKPIGTSPRGSHMRVLEPKAIQFLADYSKIFIGQS